MWTLSLKRLTLISLPLRNILWSPSEITSSIVVMPDVSTNWMILRLRTLVSITHEIMMKFSKVRIWLKTRVSLVSKMILLKPSLILSLPVKPSSPTSTWWKTSPKNSWSPSESLLKTLSLILAKILGLLRMKINLTTFNNTCSTLRLVSWEVMKLSSRTSWSSMAIWHSSNF